MTYLILSDVHVDEENLKKVLKLYKNDLCGVIFAGDGLDLVKKHVKKNLYYVPGNVDQEMNPSSIDFKINNIHIFLTHGHHLQLKNGLNLLKAKISKHNFHLSIFGHTHKPLKTSYKNTILFNPGALMMGNYGVLYIEGKHFHVEHEEL